MSKTYRVVDFKAMKAKETLDKLELWLGQFQLNRPNKKIHRDFSDCTLVAKILQNFYPKLIDMNNYPSRNSVSLKYSNWELLNRKILRKIGLYQSNKNLLNFSNSTPNSLEKFLIQLMKLQERKLSDSNHHNSDDNGETEMEENSEIMTINVNKSVGNGIIQIPQKMILYSMYDNLRKELLEKNKMLEKFKQRIEHLENRMALKDQRIDELMKTVASQSIRKFVLECSNNNNYLNDNCSNKTVISATDVTTLKPTSSSTSVMLKTLIGSVAATATSSINNSAARFNSSNINSSPSIL